MRYDPIDIEDAQFIIEAGNLANEEIEKAIKNARIPDIPEIQGQFQLASAKIMSLI